MLVMVINGIIKVMIWYGNGEVMVTRVMYSFGVTRYQVYLG